MKVTVFDGNGSPDLHLERSGIRKRGGTILEPMPRSPDPPDHLRQPQRAPQVISSRSPINTRLVVLLGALTAFGPLSIDMYLPGLPSISRQLGASTSQAQLTLSACLLGLALGPVIAGPISDIMGRRLPLLFGLAIYSLASFLCMAAPSIFVLIGLRFVQGLAGAAGIVISRAILRDLYSGTTLARVFSLLILVNGLAPIFAPIIGGQLLRFFNWQSTFMVLGIIGLLLLLIVATLLKETLPPERRQSGGLPTTIKTFGQLIANPTFVGYTLAYGLVFACLFAYISGFPFVVQDIYGASPQLFSIVFGINGLGLAAAGQINGQLVSWVPQLRLLTMGLIMTATGGIGLLLSVIMGIGPTGVLVSIYVLVASLGFVTPNASALALSDHPRIAGSASALLGILQYVIGAAVTPIVGAFGSKTALPMAVVITTLGVSALGVFALLSASRKSRSRGRSSALNVKGGTSHISTNQGRSY